MIENSPLDARRRLSALADRPSPRESTVDLRGEEPEPARAPEKGGRLVEHWVPGSLPVVRACRAMAARHRVVLVLAGAGALAAAVSLVTVLVVRGGGTTERPPPLAVAGPVAGPPPPAPSSAGIVVSVVGRVASPGVISLPDGSRVADAIHAVGGVAAGVDAGSLNLARRLADGEQLHVGVPAPPGADPPEVGSRQPGSPAAKIDLNTATVAQLDTLPGVGQVTAQRIVDHRTRHGRFTTVDQLGQVDGIGRTRLGRLRDLVVVR